MIAGIYFVEEKGGGWVGIYLPSHTFLPNPYLSICHLLSLPILPIYIYHTILIYRWSPIDDSKLTHTLIYILLIHTVLLIYILLIYILLPHTLIYIFSPTHTYWVIFWDYYLLFVYLFILIIIIPPTLRFHPCLGHQSNHLKMGHLPHHQMFRNHLLM